MSRIRPYRDADEEKVRGYLQRYKTAFPKTGKMLVDFNEQGEVIGVAGLKTETFVEPLIAENPISAVSLARMIEGVALGNGVITIRAAVPGENGKHINQLEKDGYVILDKNITILEKNYG